MDGRHEPFGCVVVLMTTLTILGCLFMASGAYSQGNPSSASKIIPATNGGNVKITALFFAANPLGTAKLQLDEEIRAIDEKMESAKYRDVIELRSAWAARPDDLLKYLNRYKPQIVHFSGHGSETGEIILVDDKTSTSKPVTRDAIGFLFRALKDNIRLVVLNACYSKSQAQAIIENIDCAIGMNTEIGDTAAIIFAASFYRALAFGLSVQNAFDQGKAALLLENIPEDKTPELLCRTGINASEVFIVAAKNLDEYPPGTIKIDQNTQQDNGGSSAYGLTFKKIVWKHHYRANGDFQGEVEYFVKNTSNDSIVILPPHQAAWFGSHIQQPKFRTEIYGEERDAYGIVQNHFSESKDIRTDVDGRKREVTSYLWQFNISPMLTPQKSLHYGVIVETEGTELEAFTSDGSFAGMGSPYSVAEMSCELYAPEGYKFKKETQFVRDRTGNLKDFAGVSKPEFMDDDTKVIWSMEKPTPNLEYLIKVVIVKAN